MTLILKLDLHTVKMYLHTTKGSFYIKGLKSYGLNRQKHRQTDRHDQKHYLPAYAGGKYPKFIYCSRELDRYGCW